ncbi:MAG TPA: GrpB family protein, partial [Gemmatimonadaceae bacterium]|nr:GrpB family protein [Gemmatimonadaceae bacterium]
IDLLAGYPSGVPLERYIAALVRAGYVHRGQQDVPGREFFRRGEPRAYHLSLTSAGGPFWRAHLAFRDALRAAPELRDAYADLKMELARRFPRDREAYIEGKTAFVRQVLATPSSPTSS